MRRGREPHCMENRMDVSESVSQPATVEPRRLGLALPSVRLMRRRIGDVPDRYRGAAVFVALLLFVVAYVAFLEFAGGITKASVVSRTAAQGTAAYRLVDDAQASADGTRFQFVGGWERVVGQHDGRLGGTSTRSFRIGATATLVFVGRSVRVYGIGGPGGGIAAITLDGRSYGTANFASSKKNTRLLVFDSPALTPGTHRLSLIVAPPPAGGAGRGYVNIDGAAYQP